MHNLTYVVIDPANLAVFIPVRDKHAVSTPVMAIESSMFFYGGFWRVKEHMRIRLCTVQSVGHVAVSSG